ncbi:ketopantoate reductase family protein [Planctomonas psychrotolerans]|uniref:ketopantoate reductase family protein n=1 Tax=Planctomonas psychrotolerans TaxID=2528712 RepID=UPI00123B181F|nr:ketopantoate reductase family protein [Planctomonas psychrotolerans]
MRIAVIGAGAVGGTLAALLHRAGHEVDITARGDHLRAIQENGLRMRGAWGTHVASVAAAERLARPPDLAIVATKIADAPDAMSANAGYLRDVPVVVVQNGLGGLRLAGRALPSADMVGGLALFAASFSRPGEVTVTAAAPLILGVPGRAPTLGALAAKEVLEAVLPVQVSGNFEGAQWTKLLINGINAVPAITGLSVQDAVGHRNLRKVITRSMQETARVGAATGVRFDPIGPLLRHRIWVFAHLPVRFAQGLPMGLARGMGSVPNPGSTLQSIRRGRLTEIDYLNGAVVDAAKDTPLTAPVNEALVAMVHQVERTGRHLPAVEVLRRTRVSAVRGAVR